MDEKNDGTIINGGNFNAEAMTFGSHSTINMHRSTLDYDRGLERFKDAARGNDWYGDFALYEARLRENIAREQRYGSTEQLRSDRAQIID